MGARGPRPAPTKVLAARGSRKAAERTGQVHHWSHSQAGKQARGTMAAAMIGGVGVEPVPSGALATAPERPAWIADNEHAKAQWDHIVEVCRGVPGLLTALDATILAAHCDAYAQWRAARAIVNQHGFAQGMTESGTEGTHPAVAVMFAAWDRMLKSAKELGLTPAARSSIRVAEAGATFEVETVRTRVRARREQGSAGQ